MSATRASGALSGRPTARPAFTPLARVCQRNETAGRSTYRNRNGVRENRTTSGLDAPLRQRLAEPVTVIAPVTDQRLRRRQLINDDPRALVVAHLAFAQ